MNTVGADVACDMALAEIANAIAGFARSYNSTPN